MQALMNGKTVLVTGATGGIGLATAKSLAGLGATVIVHGRNPEKLDRALQAVRQESGRDDVSSWLCDFTSLREVRDRARELLARVPRLDVLVNNAGGIFPKRVLTKDGYELTFAVNHLAPMLLTQELLPALRAAAPSRVVTVASTAYRFGGWCIRWNDVEFKRLPYYMQLTYGHSKLANILFTVELSRRLAGTGITANCLHPGVVRSDFGRGTILRPLMKLPFLLTNEKGARTSVYLASSPDVAGVTGKFYYRNRPIRIPRGSRAANEGRRLWELSEPMIARALG